MLFAPLVANKCIEDPMRIWTPRVVCKLDIEKAYDHIYSVIFVGSNGVL